MNNVEKYKKYESIMDKIGNEFCQSLFPHGAPEKIYQIGTNFQIYKYGFFVEEAEVEFIMYHFKGELRKPYYNKRPTRKDVEKIKSISESLQNSDLSESDVCLHVKRGRYSWVVHLKDFREKKASTDRGEMEVILLDKIKHYKENYLLGENQFACSYCRKATDNNKKITSEIISRQYDNYRKSFGYCSEKCASYDQMAHEG